MTRHAAFLGPETAPRPRCGHCGKPYGQRWTKTVTLAWLPHQEEPRLEGTVVKRGLARRIGAGAEPPIMKRDVDVWDGKLWFGGYDPFCTLRCALDYARKAWKEAATA